MIDSDRSFDPWTLLPFYPELSALTVVGAPTPEIAGEAAASLAKTGAGFILLMGEVPEHWLGPIEAGANRSGTVLVGVVDSPGRAFAHASSLSLGFSRTEWVWDRDQLVGLRASARCVKNRVAPPVGEAEIEIRYPLGTRQVADKPIQVVDTARIPIEELACASAVV